MVNRFLKVLGPGLLYAGAAVGVSHLVQSTCAGAMFNFDLVWILIAANFLKYPFFEFGTRYAIIKGSSLVDGYHQIGKWAVVLFTILTVGSMFIVLAAVILVTAGLLSHILQLHCDVVWVCFLLLSGSAIILVIGKYSLLDRLIKVIVIVLTLSTLVALISALNTPKEIDSDAARFFSWTEYKDLLFLIAFLGWMPAPIDVSVWSSLWTVEKNKLLGNKARLKDALVEFRVGYIGTALLAIAFVVLGATVMWGTGEEFSQKGSAFAAQFINLYTSTIGGWSYWIISMAAFVTMFSTTITVLDAYPRVLIPTFRSLSKSNQGLFGWSDSSLRKMWLIILVLVTSLIIGFATSSMGLMVTVAATFSFIVEPIFAWLNYKVVTGRHMPINGRPNLFLRVVSWIGISFFVLFALGYFCLVYY